MPRTLNLASIMATRLPPEMVDFLRTAGDVADGQGLSLYLVGGAVRDLLRGYANLDCDIVVAGDALKLAQKLNDITRGKVTTHQRFGTATLRWAGWQVDLTTARAETYPRPGALPTVQPGTLDTDLFRRDFTINAMAVGLNPGDYGRLIDPHGGRDDLEQGLLRILHEGSFIDDATRIWRGLRYEQRLNFRIEAGTLRLLMRDIPRLDTISGDRLRHELELVIKEEYPEKVLRRAGELGVLSRLHPALQGDGWLAEKLAQARLADASPANLYLTLLAYRLTDEECQQFMARLRMSQSVARTLRDSQTLKAKLGSLAEAGLAPSRIYCLLHGYSPTAVMAGYLASDSSQVRQHIRLFRDKLRNIKPALRGDDLSEMGIAPGPRMKEILQRLHQARLDGEVTSRQGEEELVKRWLRTHP